MHPRPPRRTTHAMGTPKNRLVYDRWGRFGRPIVLLHGLLYDRTMWWPVAAELDDTCAAVAVDLPGHGQSVVRTDCARDQLAHDLATLIHGLGLQRAPIIVAHAESATLAEAFAERYATHAVVTLDPPAAVPPLTAETVAAVAELDTVPEPYRQFAVASYDATVLSGYRSWFTEPGRDTPPMPAKRQAYSAARLHACGQSLAHLRDPVAFAAFLSSLR